MIAACLVVQLLPASNAPTDGLVANPHGFGVNAVLLQLFGHFGQCNGCFSTDICSGIKS